MLFYVALKGSGFWCGHDPAPLPKHRPGLLWSRLRLLRPAPQGNPRGKGLFLSGGRPGDS